MRPFLSTIQGRVIMALLLLQASQILGWLGERYHTAKLESTTFTDWMEYESVKAQSEFNELGAEMWFVSRSEVKRTPFRSLWDEVMKCDYTPLDGVDTYEDYARSVSEKVQDQTRPMMGVVWPFKTVKGGAIVKGPDVPAKCIMASSMEVHLGYGVVQTYTYITDPYYFGVTK